MSAIGDRWMLLRGHIPGTPKQYRWGRCWDVAIFHVCWLPHISLSGVTVTEFYHDREPAERILPVTPWWHEWGVSWEADIRRCTISTRWRDLMIAGPKK